MKPPPSSGPKWKEAMLRSFLSFFQQQKVPPEPFVDPVLGEFQFDRDLGWKKEVAFGEMKAELVLGSEGESPSVEMVQTAREWVAEWPSRRSGVVEYIHGQLQKRKNMPHFPTVDDLHLESINVLWPNRPRASMIYFRDAKDETRAWHASFEGTEPKGLGCDD